MKTDPRNGRHQRRTPKRSRTIPIKGYGDDDGRFYKCWNCGWVCDVNRDALGDKESMNGVTYDDFTLYGTGATVGDYRSAQCVLEMLGSPGTCLVSDSDGNGIPPVIAYEPVVTSGCPFCGTKNWRGDY